MASPRTINSHSTNDGSLVIPPTSFRPHTDVGTQGVQSSTENRASSGYQHVSPRGRISPTPEVPYNYHSDMAGSPLSQDSTSSHNTQSHNYSQGQNDVQWSTNEPSEHETNDSEPEYATMADRLLALRAQQRIGVDHAALGNNSQTRSLTVPSSSTHTVTGPVRASSQQNPRSQPNYRTPAEQSHHATQRPSYNVTPQQPQQSASKESHQTSRQPQHATAQQPRLTGSQHTRYTSQQARHTASRPPPHNTSQQSHNTTSRDITSQQSHNTTSQQPQHMTSRQQQTTSHGTHQQVDRNKERNNGTIRKTGKTRLLLKIFTGLICVAGLILMVVGVVFLIKNESTTLFNAGVVLLVLSSLLLVGSVIMFILLCIGACSTSTHQLTHVRSIESQDNTINKTKKTSTAPKPYHPEPAPGYHTPLPFGPKLPGYIPPQVIYSQYANMKSFNHRAIVSRTDTPVSDEGLEDLPEEFRAYGACAKTPREASYDSPVAGSSGACVTAPLD